MKFSLALAGLITVFSCSLACARTLPTPRQIVAELYKPYLADPHAENVVASTPDALALILPYGSAELKQAIDKNKACEIREQGICNIDFDIIINGQDWDLSGFQIEEDFGNKNHHVISVSFVNGVRKVVRYSFIQQQGQWKIDEVEAGSFKESGKIDFTYKLKKELSKSM